MSDAAILFHPDGYETDRADLKGRHVAGESFLEGFFRHSGLAAFTCVTYRGEHARAFAAMVERVVPGRGVRHIPVDTLEAVAGNGCLFVPGPGLDSFAWRRRATGQCAYSLCGITHTTAESPESFGGLVTAPLQPWDALICTSRAARASVEALIEPYAAYLRERLGAAAVPLPNLPIIPLGVDSGRFCFASGDREEMRARLGIGGGDIAVLFLGRLAFHAKAHPIPMYEALERASRMTGRRVHLIQAGWFANTAIESAFTEGARRYCPSVNAIFLDGRSSGIRDRIWAAGDIFTSLADNVQETFGITPLEAMASGLPCVVSDWDGYRDTVRDGVEGFLIPTLAPPPGCAPDLAARYAMNLDSYDHYIGRTAQLAAVDIDAAVAAFVRLIESAGLRRQMGDAGRARVAGMFDWRMIVPRYLDLWAELAGLRAKMVEIAPWDRHGSPDPLHPDPLAMFASYPSAHLRPDTLLVRGEAANRAALATLVADPLNSTMAGAAAPAGDLALVLEAADPPGLRAEALCTLVPAERRLLLFRSLVTLMKFGLLREVPGTMDR